MKTDTLKLLKHFASVFRNLANGSSISSVNPLVLRYLSRKDLIEVITSSSFTNSKDVKEIDLLKMENEELLQAIGSELHIIAYLTSKWCVEGLPTDVPEKVEKSQLQSRRTMERRNEFTERFDSLQKAFDRALWLTFSHRISGKVFRVMPSNEKGYLVGPTSHPSFEGEEFLAVADVHSYLEMSYTDIGQIRSDTEPLPFWEEISGMFSVVDGEVLRFILTYKVPLERFIRHELASRGYDKNHKWCGFAKAKVIWLK